MAINTPPQASYGSMDVEKPSSSPATISQPYFQELPMAEIQAGNSFEANSSPTGSHERHVHYDSNPKVFFLPIDKPGAKVIFHDFANSLTPVLQSIFLPLVTTILIILIPVHTIGSGFLENWVFTLIYIPCISISSSIFHIGWATAFIKGYRYYSPLFIHTILVSLTFALLSQYAILSIPMIILIVPIEAFIVLPALVYLRGSDRFKPAYTRLFLRYLMFLGLVTLAMIASALFVVAFSFRSYQIPVGIAYYFAIFLLNQGTVYLTRHNTARGNHNIVCFWIETLSEMTFCLMFVRVTEISFYILLFIKMATLVRFPLALTERYWKLRCETKEHWHQCKNDTSSSACVATKMFYYCFGWLFPVSVERDEHRTRIVDRFFYTCLRFGNNHAYYPYASMDEEVFIMYVIYAFFSSFFSFIGFLVIRYFFQTKFQLSVINHPLMSLKNNLKLFMFYKSLYGLLLSAIKRGVTELQQNKSSK
eukprot:gene15046-17801_t